jgi:WS/DGAT/MGAT family acyltransferase
VTIAPDLIPGLDASYLELEHPGLPMHIGSVATFEGAPLRDARGRVRLADLRRHIESRLELLPRFRQIAVPAPLRPGRWMWVDAPDFDIADHVRAASVPSPGDEAALLRRCADIHAELLPRDRPLWQLYVVDGLADGSVAIIEKAHHTLVDGVAGVDVTMILMDSEPRPLPRSAVHTGWEPKPPPTLVDAARTLASDGLHGATRVVSSALRPASVLRDALATTRFLPVLAQMTSRAPHTSFNRSVGTHRRVTAIRRPLADLKAVGRDHGATLNDVVLSAVAGGLRALLVARGEDPDLVLRALVPVSLRGDDEHRDLGNRTGALFVDLPCCIEDAGARLEWLAPRTAAQKASGFAAASERLLNGFNALAPVVDLVAGPLLQHQSFVNLVVTNVPGPPDTIYVGGAAMLDAVPIVPLTGNVTVGIAVLSYAGTVTLGIDTDAIALPDVDVLAQGIESAFDELLAPATSSSR